MKFHVRHGDGELVVPSFKELQSLYRIGFITADDQLRRENSDRWMRLGDLPELRAMHLYDQSGPRKAFVVALWLMLGLFALSVLVQLFVLRR
jgi:hypothetical protein